MSNALYLSKWRKDRPEKSAEYSRNWRRKNPIKYSRNGAKQRGLEFNITEDDLKDATSAELRVLADFYTALEGRSHAVS